MCCIYAEGDGVNRAVWRHEAARVYDFIILHVRALDAAEGGQSEFTRVHESTEEYPDSPQYQLCARKD